MWGWQALWKGSTALACQTSTTPDPSSQWHQHSALPGSLLPKVWASLTGRMLGRGCHPAHPWLQAITHRSGEMQMRHTTPTSLHFILLLFLLFHTSSSLAPIRGILIEIRMQMADPSEPFSFFLIPHSLWPWPLKELRTTGVVPRNALLGTSIHSHLC